MHLFLLTDLKRIRKEAQAPAEVSTAQILQQSYVSNVVAEAAMKRS